MNRKKTNLLFLFFITIIVSYSQQNINLSVEIVEDKTTHGKSSGDKKIQYLNYNLYDVISELTNIPIKDFVVAENFKMKNTRINLDASSDEVIIKDDLITKFLKVLEEKHNINIKLKKENKKVSLFQINSIKFKKCKSNTRGSSLNLNGNTLIGKCITFDQLNSVINKWYKKNIYLDSKIENIKFNINIEKKESWETFKSELSYNYQINVKEEERKITVIYIN